MSKIFIIEDDDIIRTELTNLLSKYGYSCESSSDFENIIEGVMNASADLVLLDINLPMFDGYYICREIRQRSNVPIIIVTSRSNEMDELMSMNLGADDFITKPYNTQILLAHIAAILKRTVNCEVINSIVHKDVILHVTKSTVEYNGQTAELTKNELRILSTLMNNKGNIISRDDIMNDLWQSDEFIDDNTLTVNINRLRKKLESIEIIDFLVTRRGQGYIV